MTTFQSVNAGLGRRDFTTEATTPTTPRAPIANTTSPNPPPPQPTHGSEPNTPTRWSFSGVTGQRPLPTSPFANSFQSQTSNPSDHRPAVLHRGSSHHSHRSMPSVDSQDMDLDESDEGEGGSDGESIDGETGRPTKKKKGQRFFCTDFLPCNLSFTRSEHLARHIRKHTGERPFQCHCSRRFSRLDNLRQHAQTVHVNEEIPGDSLAATGTRFQRQIRTDRVRTPTGRSRASTASSQGSHTRGHSRNLSTSSIGSTSSTISRDDSRRRPPPLMMATDASRGSLRLDTRAETPPAHYGHSREPSGDISTPTSSNFSNAPNSPAFGSTYGSPMSAASRTASLWGQRTHSPTHNRRLSVPSSGNPFTSPPSTTYPPPYMSPTAPSNSSSLSNSVYGSPANPNYSFPRGETLAEIEYRRRTWHPSTYSSQPRPATSGLSYFQTPDAPRPAFAPQAATAASQPQRLPGIETFDQLPKPSTSPARDHSPMQVDPAGRPPIYPGPQSISGPNDRRGHASWDMSLHRNLTKLDIASGAPTKEQGWGQQTINEHEAAKPQFTSFPTHQPPQVIIHQEAKAPAPETSFLLPETPTRKKRMGWYAGPPAVVQPRPIQQRKSPEDSSSSEGVPTPSFSAAEYHPSIVHSNGYVERGNTGPAPGQAQMAFNTGHARGPSWPLPAEPLGDTQPQHHMQKDTEMSGLDALVAVATSEDKVAVPGSH